MKILFTFYHRVFVTCFAVIFLSGISNLYAQCDINFTFSHDPQDARNVAFATNDLVEANYSWNIDYGDGQKDVSNGTTHMTLNHRYEKPGVYYVCVSAFDAQSSNGDLSTSCQACKQVPVDVKIAGVDFSFETVLILKHNFTLITEGFGNNALLKYYWDFGDGRTSNLANPSNTYTANGQYNVCVAAFDTKDQFMARTCKEIKVGSNITASDFKFFKDTADTVHFVNSVEGGGIKPTFYWTFGDGNYSTEANPKNYYRKPGEYKVCLSVKNSQLENFGQARVCKEVRIGNNTCKASFVPFVEDEMLSTRFVNTSIVDDDASFFWDFGDGSTFRGRSPEHRYQAPGIYTVKMAAISPSSATCYDLFETNVKIGYIDIRSDFSYHVEDLNSNTVVFQNKTTGSLGKSFWDFGDGNFSSDNNLIAHRYEKPGVYNVCLTAKTTNTSVANRLCREIQVGLVKCKADFVHYVDSLTRRVHFRANVLGDDVKLHWEFGDGGISDLENPQYTYRAPGYYKVGLHMVNLATQCVDEIARIVLVGSQGKDVESDFVYQVDWDTKKVDFFNRSYGAKLSRFHWDFGQDTASHSSLAEPSFTFDKIGKAFAHVCLTTYNEEHKLRNTRCKYVKLVNDSLQCLSLFNYTVDSATHTVKFLDKSYGKPGAWTWDFGDASFSSVQNPVHTYEKKGFYKVYLKSANNKGASGKYAIINVGMGNRGVKSGFGYEVTSSGNGKGVLPVDFNGASYGDPSEFEWDFGDGETNSTSMSPTHYYTEDSVYTACLTVSDSISGEVDQYCEEIPVGTTRIEPKERSGESLAVYPNPAGDYAMVSYSVGAPTRAEIVVHDLNGRHITTLINADKASGHYQARWRTEDVIPGIYFVHLLTDQHTLVQKVIVTK